MNGAGEQVGRFRKKPLQQFQMTIEEWNRSATQGSEAL